MRSRCASSGYTPSPDSAEESRATTNRFWASPSRNLFLHRSVTSAPVTYPMHTHSEYNAVICLRGAVEVRQYGCARVAEAGEVLFGNAGISHESIYTPAGEYCEAVSLTISSGLLARAIDETFGRTAQGREQPLFLGKITSRAIRSIAARIRDGLEGESSGNGEYLYRLGRRLVTELLLAQPGPDHYVPGRPGPQLFLPRWQYVKTHELMMRSSKLGFSVPLAARRLNISPGRFHLLFRSTTGVSPAQYFQELILERASGMLTSTGSSVKEIGYELGFCSPSHFCATFKRQYGVSPLAFRRLPGSARSGLVERAGSRSPEVDAGRPRPETPTPDDAGGEGGV